MLDFLLSPPVVPFALALGLLVGLLVIEIAALLMGATLIGKDASKADFDTDAGLNLDSGSGGYLSPDAQAPSLPDPGELAQMDLGSIDPGDLDLQPTAATGTGTGLAAVLGMGQVPLLIWVAAALAGFGLSGYLLQSLLVQVFGAPLPAMIAILPAALAGLWFARGYGRTIARLIPGTETSVRSKAMLSRRRGVVSQGTARAGQPAEVRLTDASGNLHYIRAEPLDRADSITQGQEVLVLRVLQGPARGQFRIVPLSD